MNDEESLARGGLDVVGGESALVEEREEPRSRRSLTASASAWTRVQRSEPIAQQLYPIL